MTEKEKLRCMEPAWTTAILPVIEGRMGVTTNYKNSSDGETPRVYEPHKSNPSGKRKGARHE